MNESERHSHLSHITTLWTLVHRAHREHLPNLSAAAGIPEGNQAMEELVERYSGAVHRYLLAALRDPDAADELFQELCLRFLRGGFRNADPQRGRFRDFLKTSVFHLIVDYQKRRPRQPRSLTSGIDDPPAAPAGVDADEQFLRSWRDELLDRTWQTLAELEQSTRQPHHTVLRFRLDHPLLDSQQMAKEVGQRLGKPFSVNAIRQALHRAREKFADLLLEEVARSIGDARPERLESELIELGLLSYCRSALDRRGPARRA